MRGDQSPSTAGGGGVVIASSSGSIGNNNHTPGKIVNHHRSSQQERQRRNSANSIHLPPGVAGTTGGGNNGVGSGVTSAMTDADHNSLAPESGSGSNRVSTFSPFPILTAIRNTIVLYYNKVKLILMTDSFKVVFLLCCCMILFIIINSAYVTHQQRYHNLSTTAFSFLGHQQIGNSGSDWDTNTDIGHDYTGHPNLFQNLIFIEMMISIPIVLDIIVEMLSSAQINRKERRFARQYIVFVITLPNIFIYTEHIPTMVIPFTMYCQFLAVLAIVVNRIYIMSITQQIASTEALKEIILSLFCSSLFAMIYDLTAVSGNSMEETGNNTHNLLSNGTNGQNLALIFLVLFTFFLFLTFLFIFYKLKSWFKVSKRFLFHQQQQAPQQAMKAQRQVTSNSSINGNSTPSSPSSSASSSGSPASFYFSQHVYYAFLIILVFMSSMALVHLATAFTTETVDGTTITTTDTSAFSSNGNWKSGNKMFFSHHLEPYLILEVFFIVITVLLCLFRNFDVRKAEFIAQNQLEYNRKMTRSISHEIRTPLNTAFMALDLMISTLNSPNGSGSNSNAVTNGKKSRGKNKPETNPTDPTATNSSGTTATNSAGGLPEEERINLLEIAGSIREGCDISLNILNQLLTFEKLSANMMKLELKLVPITQIVEHNVLLFKMQAQQRGIRFIVEGLPQGGNGVGNGGNAERNSVRKSVRHPNAAPSAAATAASAAQGGQVTGLSPAMGGGGRDTAAASGGEANPFNELQLFVDEHKLNQVIRNLLSNAMKFTPKHGFVIVRLHWHNPTGVTIGDDVGNGGTAANGGLGRRHSGISVNQRDRGNHSNVVTFNSSTHPNGDIEHGGGGKEGMFCGSCCGFGGVSSAMPSSYLQSSSFLSSQLYNHHHMDGQPDPRRRNSMSSISSFYHSWYNHSHSSPTSTAATKTTINVKHTDSKGTKASLSNSEHSISTTARRANRYMKQVQANNPILDIMHHELSHAKAAGSLVISIIDSGPGVSEEDQSKLFNEYVQISPGQLQKGQGTGLGLSISKSIVHLHGGNIGMTSEGKGKGSTFYVELPAYKKTLGSSAALSVASLEGTNDGNENSHSRSSKSIRSNNGLTSIRRRFGTKGSTMNKESEKKGSVRLSVRSPKAGTGTSEEERFNHRGEHHNGSRRIAANTHKVLPITASSENLLMGNGGNASPAVPRNSSGSSKHQPRETYHPFTTAGNTAMGSGGDSEVIPVSPSSNRMMKASDYIHTNESNDDKIDTSKESLSERTKEVHTDEGEIDGGDGDIIMKVHSVESHDSQDSHKGLALGAIAPAPNNSNTAAVLTTVTSIDDAMVGSSIVANDVVEVISGPSSPEVNNRKKAASGTSSTVQKKTVPQLPVVRVGSPPLALSPTSPPMLSPSSNAIAGTILALTSSGKSGMSRTGKLSANNSNSSLLSSRKPSSTTILRDNSFLSPIQTIGRLHILIVDDSDMNRKMLNRLLTREGHLITEASDGSDAVELIRQQPCAMMLLSGSGEGDGDAISSEDVESIGRRRGGSIESRGSGINRGRSSHYLIEDHEREANDGSGSESEHVTRGDEGRGVSLGGGLDGDRVERYSMGTSSTSSNQLQASQSHSFTVATHNGRRSSAVTAATMDDTTQPIDLIIMDFFMNEMNGPEAAWNIRELGFNGPIIGVTGLMDDDCDEFIRLGADVVLCKPVNVAAIWKALRSIDYF